VREFKVELEELLGGKEPRKGRTSL